MVVKTTAQPIAGHTGLLARHQMSLTARLLSVRLVHVVPRLVPMAIKCLVAVVIRLFVAVDIMFMATVVRPTATRIAVNMGFHAQHRKYPTARQLNVRRVHAKQLHAQAIIMCTMANVKHTARQIAVRTMFHARHRKYPTARQLNVRRELVKQLHAQAIIMCTMANVKKTASRIVDPMEIHVLHQTMVQQRVTAEPAELHAAVALQAMVRIVSPAMFIAPATTPHVA